MKKFKEFICTVLQDYQWERIESPLLVGKHDNCSATGKHNCLFIAAVSSFIVLEHAGVTCWETLIIGIPRLPVIAVGTKADAGRLLL